MVARAPADGYTLLMVPTTFATTNSLFAKLPYDEVKDFAPVTLISSEPNFLMVHSSLPVKTVKELIALAKRRSGQLNYGFGGLGSTSNLSGLLFNQKTGVTIVGISYKSNGPAMVALLSGEVSLMFSGLPAALLPLKSGKLLALVVTGATRSPFLPDVPTMDEAGVRGYEVTN
jgi:tripartite-type tricarboxylate transporter receptor subunit TctC